MIHNSGKKCNKEGADIMPVQEKIISFWQEIKFWIGLILAIPVIIWWCVFPDWDRNESDEFYSRFKKQMKDGENG